MWNHNLASGVATIGASDLGCLGGGCKKKHSYRNVVFPKHDREKFGALELIQGTHKVSNHTHTHKVVKC